MQMVEEGTEIETRETFMMTMASRLSVITGPGLIRRGGTCMGSTVWTQTGILFNLGKVEVEITIVI